MPRRLLVLVLALVFASVVVGLVVWRWKSTEPVPPSSSARHVPELLPPIEAVRWVGPTRAIVRDGGRYP